MRIAEYPRRHRRWSIATTALMTVCLVAGRQPSALAAEKAAVAVAASNGPILLDREGPAKPWRIVKDLDVLTGGSQIIGSVGATVDSMNGAVRASMVGDVAGLSPFPILETSFLIETAKDVDFAFMMDRGRIDLINRKASGAAKIKVTVRGKSAILTLPDPGDRVALEIYGRWMKGQRFIKSPKGKHEPGLALLLIAIKGEVYVKGPTRTLGVKAPPGPALMLVDDIEDTEPDIQWLDKLPAWVDASDPEIKKKVAATTNRFKELAGKKSIAEALSEMVVSEDKMDRRGAVVILGATDELKQLAEAMIATKYDDVWDNGVIVLRNWIGRGPGQDMKLYNAMIEAKIPEADAEVIMQLLHSFSDAELRKPALYQALLDYLDNDRLAIRGLAHWHLVRLVPDGRKIEYNIHGSKEDRAIGAKAWRDLIPPGTLPGQPKK